MDHLSSANEHSIYAQFSNIKDEKGEIIPSIKSALSTFNLNEITITPLYKGLSPAKKYIIQDKVHTYVLRVLDHERKGVYDRSREKTMQLQASDTGSGPKVHFADNHVILMDYLNQGRLIPKETLKTKMASIGKMFQKLHATQYKIRPGQDWKERIEREEALAKKNNNALPPHYSEVKASIIKIWEKTKDNIRVPAHNEGDIIHIFTTEGGELQLVDFGESSLSDPLYDLAYLAIRLTLNDDEKIDFLKAYKPDFTEKDKAHFELLFNVALFVIAIRAFPWTNIHESEKFNELKQRGAESFTDLLKNNFNWEQDNALGVYALCALNQVADAIKTEAFQKALSKA